jgi:hypothetical protein
VKTANDIEPPTLAPSNRNQKTGASAPQHMENTMNTNTTNQTKWKALGAGLAVLVGLALLSASSLSALADDNRAPEVPDQIAVEAHNKVHFHRAWQCHLLRCHQQRLAAKVLPRAAAIPAVKGEGAVLHNVTFKLNNRVGG